MEKFKNIELNLKKLFTLSFPQELKDNLLKVYSKQETDENQQVINNCLDPDCSEEELKDAYGALEAIGYFKLSENAMASAKSAADNSIKGVKNFMKGFMN